MSDDVRARRLAANEATMRDVNTAIRDSAVRFGGRDHLYVFLCECSRTDCTTLLELTLDEYRVVRAHPARFALLEGHVDTTIERVVEQHDRYVIVEKIGPGRDVVVERA